MNILNTITRAVKAFLPDRGTSQALNVDTTLLEFGRLVVEQTASGKIRLKIGKGNARFSDVNYVGESIVTRSDPTTVPFGGIPVGTVLEGKGFDAVLDEAAYAYQNVSINSIVINQPDVELGQPINDTILLTVNINNIANLELGASALVYASDSIFTAQQFDPRSQYVITGVAGSFSTITDLVISVQIVGLQGEVDTKNITVKVSPRIYSGSNALDTLTTIAELQALTNNRLARTRQGDHLMSTGYSYIAIPSDIDINNIGFTDLNIATDAELLDYAMDAQQDIVGLNTYGVQITHKMFRSTYSFGGITKFRVK